MRKPLLLVLMTLTIALLLACGTGQKVKAKTKLRTRDEVKALLVGKTQEEVIEIMGRPEQTREMFGTTTWQYRGVSYDPISGKEDFAAWVDFGKDGRVEKVTF